MSFAVFLLGTFASAILGYTFGARECELGVVATVLASFLVAVRNR